jgi:hypothetical protein
MRVDHAREAVERGVALQVAFERQTLKPTFSLDRLSVVGLKGFRLWAMGQLDSTCSAPPRRQQRLGSRQSEAGLGRGVALQVASERQTLKPVFSLDRL